MIVELIKVSCEAAGLCFNLATAKEENAYIADDVTENKYVVVMHPHRYKEIINSRLVTTYTVSLDILTKGLDVANIGAISFDEIKVLADGLVTTIAKDKRINTIQVDGVMIFRGNEVFDKVGVRNGLDADVYGYNLILTITDKGIIIC